MLFPETVGTEDSYCLHCGEYYVAGQQPDPCIGRFLPGVAGCCCGHGDLSRAYVDLDTAGKKQPRRPPAAGTTRCGRRST
jgi:hypothetical protein